MQVIHLISHSVIQSIIHSFMMWFILINGQSVALMVSLPGSSQGKLWEDGSDGTVT